MTWHMFVGLVIIFSGLATYLFFQDAKITSITFLNFPLRNFSPRRFFKLFLTISLLASLSTFSLSKFQYITTKYHKRSTHQDVNSIHKPVFMNREISQRLTTAWVFNQPMPDLFIEHIITAQVQTGASAVHVYCATMKCLEKIEKLKKPMIAASFLVVPNVLGQSPLREWGERHVLYKILTGLRYEWYLTQALCLAHLWQFGGIFHFPSNTNISRTVAIKTSQNEQEQWPCMSLEDVANGKTSNKNIWLQPRHQDVNHKIDEFLRKMESWNAEILPDIFQETVWNAVLHCPSRGRPCLIPNPKSLRDLYTRDGIPFKDEYHFGSLALDTNKANVGDEIQSIARIQFLPFLDFFLERDNSVAPDTRGKHLVFFNAYWGKRIIKWPPPENIDPVMLSVHTDARVRTVVSSSSKAISFLKSKSPIGARDMITKRFMESIGVQSFFSGCMTLFIQNSRITEKRKDTIYIVDLSIENQDLLPEWIREKAKFVKHGIDYVKGHPILPKQRFLDAYTILEKYSRAKLVITRRIHAALPCVAMGTPVIFFNGKNMPGSGGSTKKSSDRVAGLVVLFHSIDLYKLTTEEAKNQLNNFNWTHPPKNPNLGIRMQMICSMWFIIRRNQAVYESARRFGMLPLTPEWLTKVEPSHVFHVVHDDTNQDIRSSGGLVWYQWRCIESILRHHPTSKLFVHSNIIEQSVFDVLTEAGYQITVKNYDVSELVEETPLETFFNQFRKTTSDELAVEKILHQNGVLKSLLLYKYGGVFLAEDTIVLKAIDRSKSNLISLDAESNVNPWMLNFERKHGFLRFVLEMFPTFYSSEMEPDEGKALLAKIWKSWQDKAGKDDAINIAKKNNFHCLVNTTKVLYDKHSKMIKNEVYVIRIPDVHKCLEKEDKENPQLKEGTICKEIYNEHCLFCSNQY